MISRLSLSSLVPVAIALLASACAPEVSEPPLVSLQQLRRAVEVGDTITTRAYVDVDAIAARLLRDFVAALKDSFPQSAPDTLSVELRTRLDSLREQWREAFRIDLGLPPSAPHKSELDAAPADVPQAATDSSSPQNTITIEADILGDGAVSYHGDTAVVHRVIRYTRLDTTATLHLALVPVEGRHWKLVALPNVLTIARALFARQVPVFERANAPRRDSIRARVVVTRVEITREPLEEWGRYAAQVRATVENRSRDSVVVRAAQLVGPRLTLRDSAGHLPLEPITVLPGRGEVLTWQHALPGDHLAWYDAVDRPDLYRVEIIAIETRGVPRHFELYRTWEEYVRDNPLPARPSGVLALGWRR